MTVLDNAPTRNGSTVATPAAPTAPLPAAAVPTKSTAAANPPAPTPTPGAPASPDRRWWMRLLGRGANREARTPEEEARAQARAFCWWWLLFAMAASVGGNVLHAWMTAPPAVRLGAAIAAIVPPSILLGATHLVALLISTRRRKYRLIDLIVLIVVMLGAIGVAYFAFTISFYSLRDLMILFGQRTDVAWRWPIAVDLSLVVSSLALLSLTEARFGHANDQQLSMPSAAEPVVMNSGPSTPAERRLWWESIATVVREELSEVRKIAELTPGQLGEILERLNDRNEPGRRISDSTGLHHREVKAIRESADGVLARTAVTAPAEVA
jgi:uncharacterized protein DUF2637